MHNQHHIFITLSLLVGIFMACNDDATPEQNHENETAEKTPEEREKEAMQIVRDALCDPENEADILQDTFQFPSIEGMTDKSASSIADGLASGCCNATRMHLDDADEFVDYWFYRPAYQDNPTCTTYGTGFFTEFHPETGPLANEVLACDFQGVDLVAYNKTYEQLPPRQQREAQWKAFSELVQKHCTVEIVPVETGLQEGEYCLDVSHTAPCAPTLACLPYVTADDVESERVRRCAPAE